MAPDRDAPTGLERSTMQSAIQAVLARESLANERKLAYTRTGVLLISSGLDIVVFFFPAPLIGQESISPTIALFGIAATLLSLAIVLLLNQAGARRRLPWLQLVIPGFDGMLLAGFITNIVRVLGAVQPMIITNVTAICCLLAVSGGMRLRRGSALLTTLIALVNFAYAASLFQLDVAVGLFAAVTIFGTGFLGMWLSNIVARQVQNEAGRMLMQRFLPKTVVEAAFETPAALLQRPRQAEVTIMVTDLRGFTRYSEKLAPVEVMEFLNHLQGFLSRMVEAHGGWVDKFMGDGMLAVFGAPDPMPNHGDQALAAAQAMLQNISEFSPLDIGIGLHSGSVVMGCLGKDTHLEYTVIGDTVNVAARLEALTKQEAYPLLMSQTTRQQLAAPHLAASVGSRDLRGRDGAVEVFTLAALIPPLVSPQRLPPH